MYRSILSQDIVVLKNGDEIKSKVLEITPNEVKYKRFDNLNGPIVTIPKPEVFMIKYENGTKDVFNGATLSGSNGKEAKIVFYRPKRFAGSAVAFIVGSSKPDTVFIKLKNGTYHELTIRDFRDWEFVGGTMKITAYQKLTVEPGKTYYVRCYLKASFPSDKGCFDMVDEQSAKKDMSDLSAM
jgi:hypothetical protein